MLSVLHIITKLTMGGAQETVFYYYDNLDRSRFEVFLLAGKEREFQSKNLLEKLSKDIHFNTIENLQNKINIVQDLKTIFEIYRFLKKNPVDIVHTHSAKAGILGRIAAWLAGVKVIVHTVHGWSFHHKMWWIAKFIYILLEKLTAKVSDKLITVTKMDIEKGLRNGIGTSEKYITIRSGINFSIFDKPNWALIDKFKEKFKGKKIIGSIGRLSIQKNYSDYLKIVKKLCLQRIDLHFVIVGDGELRQQLEQEIKQLGISDNITLLGLCTDIEVVLRSFDIFLLTSLWEGLPRVLPEAMYCKTPVVAYGVDGILEIIDNDVNGFVIKPRDIDGACTYIKQIIDDTALRERIINNALNTVEDYSAQKMLRETEELYTQLMKENQGG